MNIANIDKFRNSLFSDFTQMFDCYEKSQSENSCTINNGRVRVEVYVRPDDNGNVYIYRFEPKRDSIYTQRVDCKDFKTQISYRTEICDIVDFFLTKK